MNGLIMIQVYLANKNISNNRIQPILVLQQLGNYCHCPPEHWSASAPAASTKSLWQVWAGSPKALDLGLAPIEPRKSSMLFHIRIHGRVLPHFLLQMDGFPLASLRASLIASTPLSMYLSSTHPISGYQRYLHPPVPSCQGASTSALGVSWCHGVTRPAGFANSIAPRKWWFTRQNLMVSWGCEWGNQAFMGICFGYN